MEVFEMAPLTPLGGHSAKPYTLILDMDFLTGMYVCFSKFFFFFRSFVFCLFEMTPQTPLGHSVKPHTLILDMIS
jgi:hypothetical protein